MKTDNIKFINIQMSDSNPRTHEKDKGIEALAHSIIEMGLIAPIIVKPMGKKYFELVDGHRRFAALGWILEHEPGMWKYNNVPAIITDGNIKELALAANVLRKDLHPADQYKAFAALADNNMTPNDIAKRFGLDQRKARQLVTLGKVIDPVLQDYRDGEITYEGVTKYAQLEPKLQKKFHKDGGVWGVNTYISNDSIKSDSAIARFVGENDYLGAGGHIDEDLFGDEGSTFWPDKELLLKLAEAQVEKTKEALLNEGWAWVKQIGVDITREASWNVHKNYYEPLEEMDKSLHGVLITEQFLVQLGYVDAKLSKAADKEDKKPEKKPEISNKLMEFVNEKVSVATQQALAASPSLAMDMLIVELADQMEHGWSQNLTGLSIKSESGFRNEDKYLLAQTFDLIKAVGLSKVKTLDARLKKVTAMDTTARVQLFSNIVALMLEKTHAKAKNTMAINAEKEIDVASVWKPDLDYFNAMTKQQLLDTLKEEKINVATIGKKSALAEYAFKALDAIDWMPKQTKIK